MTNLTPARLRLIDACRLDLLSNAIDVTAMTGPQLIGLVREHLEYFQLMLGDESTPAQIQSLIRRDVSGVVARGRPSPVARGGRTLNRVPADV